MNIFRDKRIVLQLSLVAECVCRKTEIALTSYW